MADWIKRTALSAVLLAALCHAPAHAGDVAAPATPGRVVRVGHFTLPPFVMPNGAGGYRGFAIEIWREVAERLGLEVEYTPYETVGEMFTAVVEGREDVAVTALTITTERARWCRFSFPWYESGMTIMTRDDERSIWYELRQNRYIRSYALFVIVLCVLSFLMTLVRRERDDEFPNNWLDGFFLSLFNLMVLLREGSLTIKYRTWKSNLLSVMWTLFGVAAVAYVTSTLTAAMMAVSRDDGGITSVRDLVDITVGALDGGAARRYLTALQIQTVPVKNLDEAGALLQAGSIEAFVGDAPVLKYWISLNPDRNLKLTGDTFHPEKFGFAIAPDQADLAEDITLELITLHDDGTLERIARQYSLEYTGGTVR
ncbi:MAG: transporter substrate-binding domain-containing protein [Planctomycetaceae bacterium]|nr:transporter substrate-binding domain-containing protein [Planctomycetaceae bacterium]